MYFSSAVASPENRTAFVGAVTSLVKTYNLDGIDFECVLVLHATLSIHLHIAGNTQTNKGLVVM